MFKFEYFTIITLNNFPETLIYACEIITVTVCDTLKWNLFTSIRAYKVQIWYPEIILNGTLFAIKWSKSWGWHVTKTSIGSRSGNLIFLQFLLLEQIIL